MRPEAATGREGRQPRVLALGRRLRMVLGMARGAILRQRGRSARQHGDGVDENGGGEGEGPEPFMVQERQAGEGEQDAGSEEGVAAQK